MITKKDQKYYRQTRPEVTPLLPKEYFRVLEIGCGAGGFLNNLKEEIEYWGLEPNAEVLKVSADRMHKTFNGIYKDFEDEIPNDYFDLVICNDVIEHMTDHEYFFASIYKKIKKDGFLIGSVPNVRFIMHLKEMLIQQDWHYKKHGILDETHFRFFTLKSLRRSLQHHGFRVNKLSGIRPVKSRKMMFVYYLLNILSFGKNRDIKFLQLGFQVQK